MTDESGVLGAAGPRGSECPRECGAVRAEGLEMGRDASQVRPLKQQRGEQGRRSQCDMRW